VTPWKTQALIQSWLWRKFASFK